MDKTSIKRKYNYLIERFEKLKEYLKDYDNEKDKKDKEKNYLALQRITEEVVETAIKINIFILKEKNIFPKTYKESFLKLKTDFNLDEKILVKLSNTAKFRNLLAHEYINLNEKEFIKKSKEILKVYPIYLKKIYNVIFK